jgi:hypothetical protein
MTRKVYRTKKDIDDDVVTLGRVYRVALSRPWLLLALEPIVLLLTIYIGIINGTLYMMFTAFLMVFQEGRGWNQGVSRLAFVSVMISMLSAISYAI